MLPSSEDVILFREHLLRKDDFASLVVTVRQLIDGRHRWSGERTHDVVMLTDGDLSDPFWCPRLHP